MLKFHGQIILKIFQTVGTSLGFYLLNLWDDFCFDNLGKLGRLERLDMETCLPRISTEQSNSLIDSGIWEENA